MCHVLQAVKLGLEADREGELFGAAGTRGQSRHKLRLTRLLSYLVFWFIRDTGPTIAFSVSKLRKFAA
jgi:hypothetical protein